MNKQICYILLIIVLLFGSLSAMAQRLPDSETHRLAADFMEEHASVHTSLRAAKVPERACYAAYNRSDDGFVLVAADRRMPQIVLGYTDEGHFVYDSLPDALRWLLSEYDRQVEETLTEGGSNLRRMVSAGSTSTFLLEDQWGQGAPYNGLCPHLNDSACLVGCVAVAWGMVAHYYQYASPSGTVSYNWKKGDQSLSLNLTGHTYNFSNMRYRHTSSTSNVDVQTLLRDLGYAFHMDYGPSSSGAVPDFSAGAMVEHFGYDKSMKIVRRCHYDADDFDALMRKEIDEGRPIVFAGWTEQGGGHAFVCDGYNSQGFFHFNYGWSGSSNGFFRSSAVQNDYNSNQYIAIGVKPATNIGKTGIDATFDCNFTSTNGQTYSYSNGPSFSTYAAANIKMTYCMENVTTGEKSYGTLVNMKSVTCSSAGDTHASSGSFTRYVTPSDGTYRVYPVWCLNDGDEDWQKFYFRPGLQSSVTVNKSNGGYSVGNLMVEQLTIKSCDTTHSIGATATLDADLRPTMAYNKSVAWTSSNTSVVTISTTGVMRAKAAGTAVITCTAQDGSNVSDQITIRVKSYGNGSCFKEGGVWYRITDIASHLVSVAPNTDPESTPYSGVMNLESVVTHDGESWRVTAIADSAFLGCSALSSVTIPASVEKIGSRAFYGCTALTSIRYDAILCADKTTSDKETFFRAGKSQTGISLTIGEQVQRIPAFLFYYSNAADAAKIKTIDWTGASSCQSIGQYAFYHCDSLTSLRFPESVTLIEDGAFYYGKKVRSIVCERDTAPTITAKTFYFVPKTIAVAVPSGCCHLYSSELGWSAFDWSNCVDEPVPTEIDPVESAGNIDERCFDLLGRPVDCENYDGIVIQYGRKRHILP